MHDTVKSQQREVAVCGPNLKDQSKGEFHVHAADCGDVAKYGPGKRFGGEQPWILETASRTAIAEEVYSDQIGEHGEEEGYVASCLSTFHFAPCCASLPESDPAEVKDRGDDRAAFLADNPYAAEADRLLDVAIEKRSEHVLRRAEIHATLAVAFEQRQTRLDLYVGLENHAQQTGGV